MAKLADIAFKVTTGTLGAITAVTSLYIGANFFQAYVRNRQVRYAGRQIRAGSRQVADTQQCAPVPQ